MSFYKYASLIFPSLERVATSRILRRKATGGNRLPTRAVDATSRSSTDRAECVSPSQSECNCTVCLAASDPEWMRFKRRVSLRPKFPSF